MLLKNQILEEYNASKLHIKPFNIGYVGPNSYDVRLGDTLLVYDLSNGPLDCNVENKTNTIKIPNEGLVLCPDYLYLGHTIEEIGSDYYVPMYDGRSSMGRLGIYSHISAGFGDIGFKSQWTLEIIVKHPIRIYSGMRIGQVFFHVVDQKHNVPENRYNGKYVSQTGPQSSLSYRDRDVT
jgi:dCTP deaminase